MSGHSWKQLVVSLSYIVLGMGQRFSKTFRISSEVGPILPLATRTLSNPAATAVMGGQAVVRVVLENHRQFYLVLVGIFTTDSTKLVMRKIGAKREDVLCRIRGFGLLYDLFWGHRIAIATVTTFRNHEFYDQTAAIDVNIRDPVPCQGLDHPDLVNDTEPFVALYPGVLEGNYARKAIVMKRYLKRIRVFWCVMVSLLVAVIAGVVAGFLTGSISTGNGTAAGIIGIVAILVSLLTWVTE